MLSVTLVLASACLGWSSPPEPPETVPPRIDSRIARPPVAKKSPIALVIHDDRRVDDYGWLRERTNPEVVAYLKAENDYTAAVMKPTLGFQDALYAEMLGRTRRTEISPPTQKGDYWYYTRMEPGRQYPIQCRKRGRLGAVEEVVLDLNQLAEGHAYLSVHEQAISDDGRFLAYTTDVTGGREFRLHVKDLNTGEMLGLRAEKVRSLAWAADHSTLFFIVEDAAKRPYRLYRRTLGGGQAELLYEERDERFRLYVRRTSDAQFIVAESRSFTTTETRIIPSRRPAEPPRLLLERRDGVIQEVEHREGRFYVRTNDHARDFRLISFPDADARPEAWREVVPPRVGIALEEFRLFRDYAVILRREAGLPSFRVIDLGVGTDHPVVLPETICSIGFEENPEFDATRFRFHDSTPVTPSRVFEYDMLIHKLTLVNQTEVPGALPPDRYTVERTHATAGDGVRVPITLTYRKDTPRDGTAPALLIAYGAYGEPMEAGFEVKRLGLLDRGVVVALAHVRGGGDLGSDWRDQGRTLNKRNSITDFIAAAEELIARRYTSADRLAIQSLSAGGILIGGAMNLRPDLFKAAIMRSPFVDVVNSMLDPTIPLTIPEYLEWGDPHEKRHYDSMKSYCPYTNLGRHAYPAMLLMTSVDDSQVMYWESVKYVAKLRSMKTDANPVLLKVSVNAGHKGSSGRFDALREEAFVQAFLLSRIGVGRPARP